MTDNATGQLFADFVLTPVWMKKIRQLRTDPDTPETELAAYILWSILAEPADPILNTLIGEFGAAASLRLLMEQSKSSTVQNLVALTSEFSEKQIANAVSRWLLRKQNLQLAERFGNILTDSVLGGLKTVIPPDRSWPVRLRDLGSHMPYILWYRGSLAALAQQTVAVVGARASSGYGEKVTDYFVKYLALKGKTVISGGAYGIDGVAHRCALMYKTPTVAVLAGGLDRPYPRVNAGLFTQIVAAGGAQLSEMPPGSTPTRWRFLQRNRIIAALSDAVLVMEASLRSGSLNTAGHAAQIGRELAAVPGNIDNYNLQGCYKLLREYGAEILTSYDDLAQILGEENEPAQSSAVALQDRLHTMVFDALPKHNPAPLTRVAVKAGLAETECGQVLAELQILGRAECVQGQNAVLWKKVSAQE